MNYDKFMGLFIPKQFQMMFKIDAFDGTSGVMEVESSQETPPEVVPQKTLAHVIKKQLEIKFFSKLSFLKFR